MLVLRFAQPPFVRSNSAQSSSVFGDNGSACQANVPVVPTVNLYQTDETAGFGKKQLGVVPVVPTGPAASVKFVRSHKVAAVAQVVPGAGGGVDDVMQI